MKRIKLADRKLPDYTKGEEIMNMVTHIVGGALGIVVFVLCLFAKSKRKGASYQSRETMRREKMHSLWPNVCS